MLFFWRSLNLSNSKDKMEGMADRNVCPTGCRSGDSTGFTESAQLNTGMSAPLDVGRSASLESGVFAPLDLGMLPHWTQERLDSGVFAPLDTQSLPNWILAVLLSFIGSCSKGRKFLLHLLNRSLARPGTRSFRRASPSATHRRAAARVA